MATNQAPSPENRRGAFFIWILKKASETPGLFRRGFTLDEKSVPGANRRLTSPFEPL